MPNTPEHKVEMHILATQRRAAGLPVWRMTIDLSDIWRNDDLGFEEKRDAVVERVSRSGWLESYDDVFDALATAIEGIKYADSFEEFDGWWDEIYDHADVDRVWIKLHK